MSPPRIRIGTAGFSYAHWKNEFYPKDVKPAERLAYYAKTFDTVEINVSFYRSVKEETLKNWLAQVPLDFRFFMRSSRRITHYRKLRGCRWILRDQWEQFAPLGPQLGGVLFQLAPSIKPDHGLLEDFLGEARDTRDKAGLEAPLIVEFRGRRWYDDETFRILRDAGAVAVLHDMPYRGGFWPIIAEDEELLLKSGHLLMLPEDWFASTLHSFIYLRLHGTVRAKAWSEYDIEQLELWERVLRRPLEQGKTLYAFFNNDAHAAAVRNAQQLAEILSIY